MSRRSRLARALTSGLGSTIVNAAYTFLSIPLALSFIPVREFGLWALTTQLVTYLTLVDSSLSGSISRVIIEHKDSPGSEAFGRIAATTRVVTLLQGALAVVIGTGIALIAPTALGTPEDLRSTMRWLLLGQVFLFGSGLALKWISHFLIAYQRHDIVNYSACLSPLAALAMQWIGFKLGWGLFALLWANVTGALLTLICMYVGGRRSGALPGRKCGKFDMATFRELFTFGLQLFLQVLGWQLLSASQIIVVTRVLGLEAAAIYATCSKPMMIAQQLIYRIFDYSVPALSEMAARGENDRLKQRFLDLTGISGVVAALLALLVAACNGPFVQWWTRGRIEPWAHVNDWLLALLTFAYAVNRVHGGLAWVIKDVRHIRFIFPFEGAFVIVVGALATRTLGIPGLLVVSIMGSFLFSGFFGARASERGIGLERKRILSTAWGRPVAMFALLIPLAIGWASLWSHLPSLYQCIVISAGLIPIGAFIGWRVGLSSALRSEIWRPKK